MAHVALLYFSNDTFGNLNLIRYYGTSKFIRLQSVDEFAKTALQEQRQLFEFYKVHLIPKNICKKIRPIGSER